MLTYVKLSNATSWANATSQSAVLTALLLGEPLCYALFKLFNIFSKYFIDFSVIKLYNIRTNRIARQKMQRSIYFAVASFVVSRLKKGAVLMLIYGLEQALMVTHGYDVEFNQKKETAHLVQTTDGPMKAEKSHLEYLMDKLMKFKYSYRR
jgi:hypothetical protein